MPDVFHQVYNPVGGSVLLSALVASLPPLLLAIMLAVLRVAPWRSAIAAAATAFVLAWLVWGMPLSLTIAATTHGMAYGLWPISWVVVSAVFFYNLSVESGDFDVIRRSLERLTGDRRIQIVLVAFGSLGLPVTTLGGLLAPLVGRDTQTTTRALSAMVGRQLPFFSLLIPAYLVTLFAGLRRMLDVWPVVLTAGLTFAIGQFAISNFVGPELTDTLAALMSLAAVALLLKVWRPAQEWTDASRTAAARPPAGHADTPARIVRAYATYGILVLAVLVG